VVLAARRGRRAGPILRQARPSPRRCASSARRSIIGSGHLRKATAREEPTGTYLQVTLEPEHQGVRVPALPERCPHCDAQGHNRDPNLFFSPLVRSPIRAHTTGTSQVSQILADRLVDELGDDRAAARTIVFTDSRDDAASVSAGLEHNHYRDLLRQVLVR
jgi:DEAD/DEAH box helicase domain-containing protein